MKPFNLERALAGDPVVTRGGQEVTQLHLFSAINCDYPLVGVVDNDILAFTKEGYYRIGDKKSAFGLLMAPVKKEIWVNIYEGGYTPFEVSSPFYSEADAVKAVSGNGCIKTVKIHEYED